MMARQKAFSHAYLPDYKHEAKLQHCTISNEHFDQLDAGEELVHETHAAVRLDNAAAAQIAVRLGHKHLAAVSGLT
jgi:hypothetical protein